MAIILLAVELIQTHQYHQLDKTDVPYLDKNSDFGLGNSLWVFSRTSLNFESNKEKASLKCAAYKATTVERSEDLSNYVTFLLKSASSGKQIVYILQTIPVRVKTMKTCILVHLLCRKCILISLLHVQVGNALNLLSHARNFLRAIF